MGNIRKLLNSIYLGDRFCENVIFRENKILFQINCISRLKEGTNEWNYFSERDIEHGYLVFDEVINYNLNSELPLNDEIYKIDIVELLFFQRIITRQTMRIRPARYSILSEDQKRLEVSVFQYFKALFWYNGSIK